MFIVVSLGRVQRASRWLAWLLVLAIPPTLWLGGAQPIAVGLLATPWDKVAHIAVYAVLSCAIGFASRRHGAWAMAIGFAGAMLVGLIDEAHQLYLPGRSADVEDLLADAVGAALGTVVLAVRIQLREWVAARTAEAAEAREALQRGHERP